MPPTKSPRIVDARCFVILLIFVFTAGCEERETVECPPGYFKAGGDCVEMSAPIERPAPTSEEPAELTFTAEEARALVASQVKPNKLGVGGEELRVKKNPAGRGVFVYHPTTRFFGVERLLVWWVPEPNEVYPLNGPSKGVTPDLPWPREAGIEAPRTSDVVDYVFRGRPMGSR